MGGLWHCFTHISRISQIHSGISQEIWFIYGNRLKKSQEYNKYGLLTLQSDPYHLHGRTEVSKAGVRSCEAWRSWWAMSSWDAEGKRGTMVGLSWVDIGYLWLFTYWCLVGNGWEWGNGIIIDSYCGSFPRSLLSTSKFNIAMENAPFFRGFMMIYPWKMVMFHCYVKWPNGNSHIMGWL